jgi:large conductance mechanosensitive channel
MRFAKEFKEFAMKGNVVDLAVGVVIGAAFGKIVSSLVADVIMPLIGLLVGGVDFTGLKIILKEAVDEKTPAVTLNYGQFIQTCFDFTIVAFAIFIAIKAMNKLKNAEAAATPEPTPAPPPAQEVLLTEIRDILKSK